MRLPLLTILSLSLLACGGSESCGNVDCGGSPVGEWRVSGYCGASATRVDACTPAVVAVQFTSVSGTTSIRQDMTYSQNITFVGNATATVPASCLQGIMSCAQVQQLLMMDPDLSNVSCSGMPSTSCSCAAAANQTANTSGTWSATGNQVMLTPNGGSADTSTFCQQGNTLRVKISGGTVLTLARQ